MAFVIHIRPVLHAVGLREQGAAYYQLKSSTIALTIWLCCDTQLFKEQPSVYYTAIRKMNIFCYPEGYHKCRSLIGEVDTMLSDPLFLFLYR